MQKVTLYYATDLAHPVTVILPADQAMVLSEDLAAYHTGKIDNNKPARKCGIYPGMLAAPADGATRLDASVQVFINFEHLLVVT